LNVTGITSSNARFSVVTAPPFNIAAGAQASVTVRFSPNAAGAQSGNLTIASNDPARASVVVAVTGTGGAAAAVPSIDVTPASLDFGSVNVNATRDLAVTIANRGTSALNVTAITSSNARFTIAAGGAPFTVAAGAQSTVNVRFSPNAAGAQTGNLTIASNDTARGPVTVPLNGTGNATGSGPSIEVTPSSVDFGSVNVNATRDLALTVANRGAAALSITAITLSNARFSIASGGAPFIVPAGSQSTVNLRFSPNAPGTQTGTLTIASNDPSRASVVVSLTGTGVAVTGGSPSIDVSPASLDFGNVNAGSTRDIVLTVTNRGTAALNVTAITSSNARFTVVTGGAPFGVGANGQSAVTLRFSPNAAGNQTGTLTIASNDPARATVTVPLTGVGVAAAGPQVLQIDDGTFERTMGAPGTDVFFVNRLTPNRYPATLRAVRIYFHDQATGIEEGTGITIVSGANTTGGSNINPPNVRLQGVVGRSGPQGAFAEFQVNPITIQSGDFVVGFSVNNSAGVFPMAIDTSSPYQARSYISFNEATFQLIDTLQNAPRGNFLIRAVVE
jgi:carbon monoxide dehydrogenase subunit G